MTGFEEWLDAIAAGGGYSLRCENGHATVPPHARCPHCGGSLDREPLPKTGRVSARTVVHVPTPAFATVAPYVTAIAAFDAVHLTGLVVAADPPAVERGDRVRVDVARPTPEAPRCVTFEVV